MGGLGGLGGFLPCNGGALATHARVLQTSFPVSQHTSQPVADTLAVYASQDGPHLSFSQRSDDALSGPAQAAGQGSGRNG